jgi:fructose transport system substrate-binding protein
VDHSSRAAITVLLATLAVAGCKSKAPSAGAAGPIRVGLVTKTESNPFFVKLRESAAARARHHGAELIALAGKFDGDNEGQVAAIENLIARGAKGILITPSNSSAILGAIKRARAKGILVTAIDTATEPADAVDGTFATDNFQAGRLQGAWLKAALGATPAKIVMLDGSPGSTVDKQRHDGFLAGFGITDADPMIVGRANVHGDQAKAHAAMENLLQAHPEVNVVYTINEPVARGAYVAIAARNKQDKILIGSIDGSCAGVKDVKDGKVGATSMQFPTAMAEKGVDAVVAFAKTGARPAGFVSTGEQLVTDRPMPGLSAIDTAAAGKSCWE